MASFPHDRLTKLVSTELHTWTQIIVGTKRQPQPEHIQQHCNARLEAMFDFASSLLRRDQSVTDHDAIDAHLRKVMAEAGYVELY